MEVSMAGRREKKAVTPTTVVCVTDQFSCERLIHVGRRIADMSGTSLVVVSSGKLSPSLNHEALDHLFSVSKEYGADMDVFYSDTPFETLLSFLQGSGAQHVVTGMPQEENSILKLLWERFPQIHFYTVDADSSFRPHNSERAGVSVS